MACGNTWFIGRSRLCNFIIHRTIINAMRLFGHPVHPLFIHFPPALLPADFVLSVLAYTQHQEHFLFAGFYCLAGGVVIGIFALITGLLDFFSIPKTDKPAIGTALIHGFVNGLIILIFAVIAYKEFQTYPQLTMPSTAGLIIKGILVVALFAGNYLGGKLIYQHLVGTRQTNKAI